jgi:hypothetical protein
LKDQNSLRNFTTAKDEKALGEVFESLRGALGQDASVQDEVFAWYRGRLKIITALHASIVTNLLRSSIDIKKFWIQDLQF